MGTEAIIIIGAICVVAIILVINYGMNRLFDKGSDAIRNKRAQKKNLENAGKTENLADRFGKGNQE